MEVPLPETSARGLTPGLSLHYGSSSGNGPFGLGFHLGLALVQRKADKGVPRYDGTDAFEGPGGEWVPLLDPQGKPVRATRQLHGLAYQVQSYCCRHEGTYADIQHWVAPDGQSFWQVRSSDDKLSFFGRTATGRVADPQDPRRIFQWLIEETEDDHGNRIRYTYKAEDNVQVPDTLYEAGRDHQAARYPLRIAYGNYFHGSGGAEQEQFAFQLLFDYGQVSLTDPAEQDGEWSYRPDPHSDYRPGFEVRTMRLCRRVLLYHQFHDQQDGEAFLVESLALHYQPSPTGITLLTEFLSTGHRLQPDGTYWEAALPVLRLAYTPFAPQEGLWDRLVVEGAEQLSGVLGQDGFQPIDLHGEGLPGMLYAHGEGMTYFEPMGEGRYAAGAKPLRFPIDRELADATLSLGSLNGNGRHDLLVLGAGRNGYYPADGRGQFMAWENFAQVPSELQAAKHEFVDLSGRGFSDLLVFDAPYLRYYPSEGSRGFGQAHVQALAADFPLHDPEYKEEAVLFLDLIGDGLQHRVRIRAGSVALWPNLGHGRFGQRIELGNAPQFGGTLDVGRLHFADIDGSGTLDLVYAFADRVEVYFNHSGNSFSDPVTLPLPRHYDELSSIRFMDVRGNGTACLVLSKLNPEVRHDYFDFCRHQKPYLLHHTDNGMGVRTHIHYGSSVQQYLADKRQGRPWPTRLFFPVHVVEAVETLEYFNQSRYLQRFAYHDGYYDPVEREFRGFGFVESWDTDHYEPFTQAGALAEWQVAALDAALHVPPTYTKTWFHTGALEEDAEVARAYRREYWQGDAEAFPHLVSSMDPLVLAADGDTYREAFTALAGQVLRTEVYGLDGSPLAGQPYTVSESASHVRLLQPRGHNRHPVLQVDPRESYSYAYDRQAHDPLITHQLDLALDEYGHPLLSASVSYPRRAQAQAVVYPEQQVLQVALSQQGYLNLVVANPDDPASDCRLLGLPISSQSFQVNGVQPANGRYFTVEDLHRQAEQALQAPVPYHMPFASSTPPPPQARLLSWNQHYYWNADQTDAAPLGTAFKRALPHHEANAELAADQVSRLYGPRFPDGQLDTVMNQEAGYWLDGGYWWNRGQIQHYDSRPGHFYLPIRTDNAFPDVLPGSALDVESSEAYDPYGFLPISSSQVLDQNCTLTTTYLNDYQVMAPWQTTDPNGTVCQVLYDPLGKVIAATSWGQEGGKPVGDADISTYAVQAGATKADVLADPARFLQDMGSFFYYDYFAFRREQQPCCGITVTRQTHVHALPAGGTSAIQLAVAYADGLGRSLVAKQRNGNRWQATGRTVYNNKGQPSQQYQPYFSETSDYLPQEQAMQQVQVPPPSVLHYDPLGRITRTDTPKGFFSRNVYGPWEHQTWDLNDTVKASPYYRAQINNADPSFADELDALHKAARHYGTPSRAIMDNLGHVIRSITDNLGQLSPTTLEPIAEQAGLDAQDLFAALVTAGYLTASGWVTPLFQPYQAGFVMVLPAPYNATAAALTELLLESCLTTYTRYDFEGRSEVSLDPRLYWEAVRTGHEMANVAWTYSMSGQALFTLSTDGGSLLVLENVFQHPVYSWDPRGFTHQVMYDRLQRAVARKVVGDDGQGLVLNQYVEQTVYGEQVADAAEWNLIGQVYQHYGEDGLNTYPAYSYLAQPLRVEQRLRADYQQEADWNADSRAAVAALTPLVMGYAYDALGAVILGTMPDGTQLLSSFDDVGHLLAVERVQPDGSRITEVKEVHYDAHGARTLIRYGNGVQTRYIYEATTLNLLVIRSTAAVPDAGNGKPGVKVLQDLHTTYDPTGNVTRSEDKALASFFEFVSPASPLQDYTYDPLYQLISATGPMQAGRRSAGTQSEAMRRAGNYIPLAPQPGKGGQQLIQYQEQYAYDRSGNLVRLRHRDQAGGTWTKDFEIAVGSNQMVGLDGESYPYDASGNLLKLGRLPGIHWDYRNNIQHIDLVQREDGQGADAEYYVYDSNGTRVRKVWERMGHGGKQWEVEERRYFQQYEEKRISLRNADGDEQLLLFRRSISIMDGSTCFATLYTWELDGSGREVPEQGETRIHYHLQDLLGSQTMELGEQGNLLSCQGHLPYGGSAYRVAGNAIEWLSMDYGYSGKERDSATGLIYYGRRYYPPWLCRWINPDPGGLVDGLNLYAFVRGNPTTHADADGRAININQLWGRKKKRGRRKAINYDWLPKRKPFYLKSKLLTKYKTRLQEHVKGVLGFASAQTMNLKTAHIAAKLLPPAPASASGNAVAIPPLTPAAILAYHALRLNIKFSIGTGKENKGNNQVMGDYLWGRMPGKGKPSIEGVPNDEDHYYKITGGRGDMSAGAYQIEFNKKFSALKKKRDDYYNLHKLDQTDDKKKWDSYAKHITSILKKADSKYHSEWLHAQGAQLGGKNAYANLRAGSHGANRVMLGIENVLQAFRSSRNKPAGATLEPKVTFITAGQTLCLDSIRYQVQLTDTVGTFKLLDLDINPRQARIDSGSSLTQKITKKILRYLPWQL